MRVATAVGDVDTEERIIEVIAVPYDEEAVVEYRQQYWKESFERGAFDGIEERPHPIMVNREHVRGSTVGKVLKWWPDRVEGLVAEVLVAETVLGDETLALAKGGMIRASIGFGVRPRDQVLDRQKMTRRIRKAFADHLSLVEAPAYAGTTVLGVRSAEHEPVLASDLSPIVDRPAVDELAAFLTAVKARHGI
jgi:phage head maturation protease